MKESENAVKMQLLSHVRPFAILWTVARQAPLSMGFSMQGYWSGVPFLFPGDLPNPGIELQPPALQSHQGIPERGGLRARPEGWDEDDGMGGGLPLEVGLHILREWIRRRNVVKNI